MDKSLMDRTDTGRANRRPDKRHWGWRVLAFGSAVLTALTLLGGVAQLAMNAPEEWLAGANWIATVKPWLVLLHFTVIGFLWWRWNQLVDWLYRRGRIASHRIEACLEMRTSFAVWLVLLELATVVRPWEWLHRL